MNVCLLDMDGVIADFIGSMSAVLGKKPLDKRPQPYDLHLQYDMAFLITVYMLLIYVIGIGIGIPILIGNASVSVNQLSVRLA